jgi:demethylmenaquinone methyltransferase/2-methoxy-6-polyprenyl-1,4-benzoquinol methylase
MYLEIYKRFAEKYDLVTLLASFGIEEIWRAQFAREIRRVLGEGPLADIATATGEVVKKICPNRAYLVDPSPEMLGIAARKLATHCPNREFHFLETTGEEVQFPEPVEVITLFMAVRNLDNLHRALSNLVAQLEPGGYLGIVELVNRPGFFGKLGLWYLRRVVPVIGGVLTGRREDFYHLAESVERLREESLLEAVDRVGLKIVSRRYLFPPLGVYLLCQKGVE